MFKCSKVGMTLGSLFVVSSAFAAPVMWEANGHYYDVIRTDQGLDWFASRDQAAASTFMGVNGYLATVTSAEETDFLVNTFGSLLAGDFYGTWIGAYQDPNAANYSEPGGGWTWITGEEWSYENWHGPEPSNSRDGEDGLQFKWTNTGASVGQWNDSARDSTFWESSYRADFLGYVVEYEPVPEPATMTLLGVGALALLRRKKKSA